MNTSVALAVSALFLFSCQGPPPAEVIAYTAGEDPEPEAREPTAVAETAAPAEVEPAPAETPTPPEADIVIAGADDGLQRLLAGNERFVNEVPSHNHESIWRRMRLAEGQNPFAVVLGCADSRVPPELVFDHGFGDLFVIRVAGNVVAEDEAGSIEYAIGQLDTRVVVVLGHEGCGAVTAALEVHGEAPQELSLLIERVRPALVDIDRSLPMEQQVQLGVEANVRQSVAELRAIQTREGYPASQRAMVVGAVYELRTGRVRILD